jgi:Ran GTPase-activating protein (RanGAP) involved in mRNA processing and transport
VRRAIQQWVSLLRVRVSSGVRARDVEQLLALCDPSSLALVELRVQEERVLQVNGLVKDLARAAVSVWLQRVTCLELPFAVDFSQHDSALLPAVLAAAPRLRVLNVRGCGLGARGMRALYEGVVRHRSVRVLDIGRNELTAEGLLETLAECPVEELDVSWNNLDRGAMVALVTGLAAGRSVRVLRACDMCPKDGISALWADAVGRLPLVELRLAGGVRGQHAIRKVVAALPETLRTLDLSGVNGKFTDLGKALEKALAGLRLERLDVSRNPLGGNGFKALCRGLVAGDVGGLRELDVTRIAAGQVGMLQGLEMLQGATSLRALRVRGNGVSTPPGEDAAWAFSGVWRQLRGTLRKLDLGATSMSAGSVGTVARALHGAPLLAELNVGNSTVDGAAAAALGAAVASMPHLRRLSLSGCAQADEGAVAAVVAALAAGGNTALYSLRLAACSLGDDGTIAVAAALPGLRALASLDLSFNGVGEPSMPALAAAFAAGAPGLWVCVLGNSATKLLCDAHPGRCAARLAAGDEELVA